MVFIFLLGATEDSTAHFNVYHVHCTRVAEIDELVEELFADVFHMGLIFMVN